jgi:FkbH-like protein
MADPDAIVLGFTLADRFADHGLVGSILAVREGGALRVDSWLLSCRVFSRTAEDFMMTKLIDLARQQGYTKLIGEYLPSPRNSIVAELYPGLGFEAVGSEGRWWRLAFGKICHVTNLQFVMDTALS